jgi:hypothetical protein
MEDEMLKVAAVCAALIALATGPLGAYEREANIQRIAGSDDTSDMIVATPKSANAPIYDLGESPDALIIHLTGGELWIGYDDAATMLEGIEMLHHPIGAFHVGDQNNPVAVYIIPKGRALTALGR